MTRPPRPSAPRPLLPPLVRLVRPHRAAEDEGRDPAERSEDAPRRPSPGAAAELRDPAGEEERGGADQEREQDGGGEGVGGGHLTSFVRISVPCSAAMR